VVDRPLVPSENSKNSDNEEFPLAVLEQDETIPPRPEEELADLVRADPDPH
jgi:hypothetical protein